MKNHLNMLSMAIELEFDEQEFEYDFDDATEL